MTELSLLSQLAYAHTSFGGFSTVTSCGSSSSGTGATYNVVSERA